MTEGKKASRARKSRPSPPPRPPLRSRSGSATGYRVNVLILHTRCLLRLVLVGSITQCIIRLWRISYHFVRASYVTVSQKVYSIIGLLKLTETRRILCVLVSMWLSRFSCSWSMTVTVLEQLWKVRRQNLSKLVAKYLFTGQAWSIGQQVNHHLQFPLTSLVFQGNWWLIYINGKMVICALMILVQTRSPYSFKGSC